VWERESREDLRVVAQRLIDTQKQMEADSEVLIRSLIQKDLSKIGEAAGELLQAVRGEIPLSRIRGSIKRVSMALSDIEMGNSVWVDPQTLLDDDPAPVGDASNNEPPR
jgi:hypothetical protein